MRNTNREGEARGGQGEEERAHGPITTCPDLTAIRGLGISLPMAILRPTPTHEHEIRGRYSSDKGSRLNLAKLAPLLSPRDPRLNRFNDRTRAHRNHRAIAARFALQLLVNLRLMQTRFMRVLTLFLSEYNSDRVHAVSLQRPPLQISERTYIYILL